MRGGRPGSGEGEGALRLFVACELPDDARQAIAGVQNDLRRLSGDSLRWVRPEGIHITLKFLGAVPSARVDAITSALGQTVRPFELRLRAERLGTFGSPPRTGLRVVWLGLAGDVERLAELARTVDASLEPLGFPRERRAFAPHVTLARARDHVPPAERRRVGAAVEAFQLPPLPPMLLTEVRLMRSVMGPGGSVYQPLAVFPQRAVMPQK